MANICISLNRTVEDGTRVSFRAPCACNAVTGISVTYYTATDSTTSTVTKVFTFKDSHGNNLTGLGNLFLEGSLVEAMLDVTNSAAIILNADTNRYLEDKMTTMENTLKLNMQLASGNTILSAYQYGDSLPAAGIKGRIFFKKV